MTALIFGLSRSIARQRERAKLGRRNLPARHEFGQPNGIV